MDARQDPFGAVATLAVGGDKLRIHRLDALAKAGVAKDLARLPYSIRILLEALLRNLDGFHVTEADVRRLAGWNAAAPDGAEVPFKPARVLLQDFTGVPVVVDLAAMRVAMKRLGGDPSRINPLIPVDLVADHSVQVDFAGTSDALARNSAIEYGRNRERYEFLKWGQKALRNFRLVPPATGIVHQVNLEYLASVVVRRDEAGALSAYPDTVVGTDSHTVMVNGLGVLGWGVGGIEAEAVMLGQPLFLVTPQVVGFRLTGQMKPGVTATDLVLTVTQMLRAKGVVEKFVEFTGDGLASLPLADRATVANMAPEYGATCGFFPVDDETLAYLRFTGREASHVSLVEAYAKEQGLFRTAGSPDPVFSDLLSLDLGSVEPSLAGPKRPQDRVPLAGLKESFRQSLTAPVAERGFGLAAADVSRRVPVAWNGTKTELGHGSVVIAAITSCTNTSNPGVLLAAGLVAKKAAARGMTVPKHVKTSLAPGSKAVTEYLQASGLLPELEKLGFHVVGYGCTTCIGNSGPLSEAVGRAVVEGKLVASAVLSGNRNFEGRIHPLVRAAYLASPPLVVAFALAGTTDLDVEREPLGTGSDGKPVFLRDLWPTPQEIAGAFASITPEMFRRSYADVFHGGEAWEAIHGQGGQIFAFRDDSTYVQLPPFFDGLTMEPAPVRDLAGARILGIFGDSITTDHISPAGDIAEGSPAGRFLAERGAAKADFNSYGSRRGNHLVMMRGTFANVRLKNLMIPGVEGGMTVHQPSGERMSLFDASERYRQERVPLVLLAGKEYGSGSSRDWAAKGPYLLGVRAVIAESYERIHRSNLVGMGILPLVFPAGATAQTLGFDGTEEVAIEGFASGVSPHQKLRVRATRPSGHAIEFEALSRLDGPVDVEYYRNGGILQTVLRGLVRAPGA